LAAGWLPRGEAGVLDIKRSRGFTAASVPDGYDQFMLRQLFEPWAADLVARAGLKPGCHVLDVASGLGPVARLAAAAAGPGGRVVASDISAPMLALASARPVRPGWAPIEYLECPASAIVADDDSFDVVLCQQGLQFFPDHAAAVGEMRRVTRPGGAAVMSTWATEHPLGLFGPMIEALREAGMAEPFPRAFDSGSYRLSVAHLRNLLQAAGFRDVGVETVELDATWQTAEAATATLLGTPFGPLVSALPAEVRQRLRARFADKLGNSAGGVTVRTVSNVAQGIK
jgi:ubiquinone/menaquinone biosynthesis C-methylase UbiE